jgi:hypothetical protein
MQSHYQGTMNQAKSNRFQKVAQTSLILAVVVMFLTSIARWGGNVASGPNLWLGLGLVIGLFIGYATLIWWLFVSPLPAGTQVIQQSSRSPEIRQLTGLLVVLSGTYSLVGGVWDQGWHQLYGGFGDDFLWPPHFMLYASFGLIFLFAGLAIWVIFKGRGGLRSRFRAEPLLGFLGVVATFILVSIPSDILWHKLYGVDITGWSLPHVLLGFCFSMIMIAAIFLQRSLLPERTLLGWQGLRNLHFQEFLMILSISIGISGLVMVFAVDWDTIDRIVLVPSNAYEAAFWSRPIWLYTAIMAMLALFAGKFTLSIVRFAGSASLMCLLVIGFRWAAVTILESTYPATHLLITHHWLLLAPCLVLDILYSRTNGTAKIRYQWLIESSLAVLAFLLAGFPLIQATMIYPIISSQVIPSMVLTGLLFGAAGAWAGLRLGEWGRTFSHTYRTENIAVRSWVNWVALGALLVSAIVSVTYMLTAQPPL